MNWELGGTGAPGSRGWARSGSEVAGCGWDPRGRILVSSPAWLSPDCVASRGGVASLRTSAPTSESVPRHHGPGSSFCRSTGFRVWGGGAYGLVHCLVLGEEPGGRSIRPRKSCSPSARVLPLSSGPLSLQVLLLVVSSVSCGSSPEAREASPCFSHPDGPSSRVPCVHI